MNLLDVILENKEEKMYKVKDTEVYYKMKNGKLYCFSEYSKRWEESLKFANELRLIVVEEYSKNVENPFKRVKDGEVYYYITNCLKIEKTKDYHVSINNATFFSGNYFNDEETAKEALEWIRECLDKFKEHKLNELGIKE